MLVRLAPLPSLPSYTISALCVALTRTRLLGRGPPQIKDHVTLRARTNGVFFPFVTCCKQPGRKYILTVLMSPSSKYGSAGGPQSTAQGWWVVVSCSFSPFFCQNLVVGASSKRVERIVSKI